MLNELLLAKTPRHGGPNNTMAKVLIGCPTYKEYEYCLNDYLNGIKNIQHPDYDILLVDNSEDNTYYNNIKKLNIPVVKAAYTTDVRERIALSRNVLRKKVLDEGYDYLFSLEQDIIPPPHALTRLLSHNKPIVSGIYFKLYPITVKDKTGGTRTAKTLLPLIFKFADNPEEMHVCYPQEVDGSTFFKIRACGLGCLLIHRSVLEQISFRHEPTQGAFDDFLFCTDATAKNLDIYADTSVKCKHLFLKKGNVFKQ